MLALGLGQMMSNTGIGFMTVMMTAADQHEEANAQRDEAENPKFDGANAANSVSVVGEFDLSEFAVELEAVLGGASGFEGEDSDSDDNDGATAHCARRRSSWQGGNPPCWCSFEWSWEMN